MKAGTILLQKTQEKSLMKDTEKDFGVVCLSSELTTVEVKDLPSNDWADEDGTDEYIPATLPVKSAELTLKVGYKGAVEQWEAQLDAFLDYLTGNDGSGAELMIYIPYYHMGRVGRLEKVGKPEPYLSEDMMITFPITIRINNPRERIQAVKDDTQEIKSLAVKIA